MGKLHKFKIGTDWESWLRHSIFNWLKENLAHSILQHTYFKMAEWRAFSILDI